MAADSAFSVQVFGYRDSRPTQHAIRFFRERQAQVVFVDLARRPPARGELMRFVQNFGANSLLDETSRAYRDAGLAWQRLEPAETVDRLLAEPRLLRLPLIRAGNRLSVGTDEANWRVWLARA